MIQGQITPINIIDFSNVEEVVNEIPQIYLHVTIDTMLMHAYLDYCYADSVKVIDYSTVQWFYGTGDPAPPFDYMKIPWKQPTFKGYIEWLEKLLKE